MAEKAKYVLGSSEMFFAPGFVRWAINGANFKKDQPLMINMVASAWGIPADAAKALVLKKVPYEVDGEKVVFEA